MYSSTLAGRECAMYLRRSRADIEKERLGHFKTLEVHEANLTAEAKRMGALVSPENIYREIASGESVAERPEFQAVMEGVRAGRYAGIFVHAVDRLGRGNPMEYGWVLMVLRTTGTLVATPGKIFDPTDELDYQMLQTLMFVSQFELSHIKRRLTEGMRASAERGCFPRPVPAYGYRRAKTDKGWTLEPDPVEAPTARMVFEMAARGDSSGSIARHLNDSGIPTRKGKRWTAARITTMVRNPVYKGMIRFGYWHERKVMGDGMEVQRVREKRDDYVYVPGLHEPLATDEDWERANATRAGSSRVRGGARFKNPLSGLVFCPKCGHAIILAPYHSKSGKVYLRMRHQYGYDEGCAFRSIDLRIVLEELAAALESIANDMKIERPKAPSRSSELKALRAVGKRESDRMARLLDLYMAGDVSIDQFRELKADSERKVEAAKQKIAEIEAESEAPRATAATVKKAVKMIADPNTDPQRLNDALRQIISRIELDNRTTGGRGCKPDYDLRMTVTLK